MTTVDVALTGAVLTANVALVCPASTTTLACTVASSVLLLASGTNAPPVGAGASKVTVAVEALPPTTLLGFKVTAETALETTKNRVWVTVVPLREAEMTTPVVAVTGAVLAVKVALVCPAGTVTLAGIVTRAVLALESVTTVPPAGATMPKVTVPVAELPPITLPSNNTWRSNVNNVMSAFKVTPLRLAVTLTLVVAVTALVVTMKLALVAPAGAVTLAGTLAEAESSESVTTAPPLGAALVKVTVPVEVLPPVTLDGLRTKAESVVAGAALGVISKSACGPGEVAPTTRELMFKLNCPVTVEVAMVKLALVAPAGTVTM